MNIMQVEILWQGRYLAKHIGYQIVWMYECKHTCVWRITSPKTQMEIIG